MDVQRIKVLIKRLGFSEWETSAYFVLIYHGPQTAFELGRLSKIPRSKTYEVVSRLRRKGFVMKVPAMPTKGVTQKFVALDPKNIFETKIDEMKELSLSLENMYKSPTLPRYPKVNMYTSKEAVKGLMFDLSLNSKTFSIYFSDLNLIDVLGFSFDHIFKTISKKKSTFLLRDTPELREFSKRIKNHSFIKTDESMSFIVTENRVILDLYKTQHVVLEIISSPAVKTFNSLLSKLSTNTK